MQMHRRMVFVLLAMVLVHLPCRALAQPRVAVALGDDETARQICAATKDLFDHLAKGDAEGARKLFAGRGEQQDLLEAYIEWIAASSRLKQSLVARFGQSEATDQIQAAEFFAARAKVLSYKILMVNGDDAAVAAGSTFDCGVLLHRLNGGWRVTGLALRPTQITDLARFLRGSAATAKGLAERVDAGRFDSIGDAMHSYSREDGPLLAEFIASIRRLPATLPAAQPMAEPRPGATALRELIGQPLAADAIAELIAGLPGLPRVSQFRDALYINSEEAGIDLRFNGRTSALEVIWLYAQGADGHNQYAGDLPLGLSFTDTRRDVERKLGRPISSGGGGSSPYQAHHVELGIHVGYRGHLARDQANVVDAITILAPRPDARTATRETTEVGPRLAFRLIAGREPEQGEVDLLPDPDGVGSEAQLRVQREVLLDETDVRDISWEGDGAGKLALAVEFRPDGARRLAQFSVGHEGRRLAIVRDGQVLFTFVIKGVDFGRVLVAEGLGQPQPGMTDRIGRLHAAVYASPSDSPASRTVGR